MLDELRVTPDLDLALIDPHSTPGWTGGRTAAEQTMHDQLDELSELQEKLFAHGRQGGTRRVLLVLQAMDTAGKGGVVRHVVGAVDPQGVRIASFGAPTPEELEHDFLWRIRAQLPQAGRIGVFDRSHYEDLLVPAVRQGRSEDELADRVTAIRDFEAELAAEGTVVRKVMLHISRDEQKERLRKRLDRADKHWKYNPHDLEDRARWDRFQAAYRWMLQATDADEAPWYVVPADRKWFARFAVHTILLEALRGLELDWPAADFDVEAEKRRLEAS